MDGVTIRGGGEQARLPLAVLPLLLCGVWGFLLVFRSLDGVSFHPVPAFLTAAVLLSVLWAGCRRGGRWFVPVFLASLTLLCVLATRYWAMRPGVQAGALLGYWYGDRIPALAELFGTAPPEQATELAVILAAVLSIMLFSLECLFRDHEIPYTLATALLVYVPLLGLRADIGAVFLLALFRLALRSVQNALSGGTRSLLPGWRRTRLAGQCAALLSILLALSFLSADLLVQRHEDALYAPAYHAEELAVRGLREAGERWRGFFSNSGGGGLDGEIGGGNQYQTNGAQLELSASTCPTQTLYLRSFAGGDYTGGAWAAADDDAIFQAVQPEMMPEDPEAW
ncbi:MAG: hypothetical protein IJT94_16195, partial [Oscillibacter sp.]|nr:hypothetical protein [Oscillibacter sp.]